MELLDRILTKENFREAYNRVYANKGASGVDGMEVEDLYRYLTEHIDEIFESIKTRKYKPKPVRRVEIPKENGSMRQLGIPTAVDRVIQQAISQILTPIYEEQFSDSSFGFRPHLSCQMAVIRSLELLNSGYEWVVDIDLERFFDTVHHDRLMTILFRTIKDGDLLSLIRKYLESGVMIDDKYQATRLGTPQGGNLSPLLSNVMLNELDKELEKRGLCFVRYADDCNIYVKSQKAANRVMKSITKFIEKKLGLIVNADKSQIGRPEQIKFLGFGYFKDKKDNLYYAKPHAKSIGRLVKVLKYLTRRNWSLSMGNRLKLINQKLIGWVNYFRFSRMKSIARDIDVMLRNRTRVILWKQWKTITKRCKSLMALGATYDNAFKTANSRKGYIRVCKSPVIKYALSNNWLKKKGMIYMSDLYAKVH